MIRGTAPWQLHHAGKGNTNLASTPTTAAAAASACIGASDTMRTIKTRRHDRGVAMMCAVVTFFGTCVHQH